MAEAGLIQKAEIAKNEMFMFMVDLVGGWYFNHVVFEDRCLRVGLEGDIQKGILLCGDCGLGKSFVFEVYNSLLRQLGYKPFVWLNIINLNLKADKNNGDTNFLNHTIGKAVYIDDLGKEERLKFSSALHPEYIGERILDLRSSKHSFNTYAHGTTNFFTQSKGNIEDKYNASASDRVLTQFNIVQLEYLKLSQYTFRGLPKQNTVDVWEDYDSNKVEADRIIGYLEDFMADKCHPTEFDKIYNDFDKNYKLLRHCDPYMRLWQERKIISDLLKKIKENKGDYIDSSKTKVIPIKGCPESIINPLVKKLTPQKDKKINYAVKYKMELEAVTGVKIPTDDKDFIFSFYRYYTESLILKKSLGEEEFTKQLTKQLKSGIEQYLNKTKANNG